MSTVKMEGNFTINKGVASLPYKVPPLQSVLPNSAHPSAMHSHYQIISLNHFLVLCYGHSCLQFPVEQLFGNPVILHPHMSWPLFMVEDYYCFNAIAFRSLVNNSVWNQRQPFGVKGCVLGIFGEIAQAILYPSSMLSMFQQSIAGTLHKHYTYFSLDGNASI